MYLLPCSQRFFCCGRSFPNRCCTASASHTIRGASAPLLPACCGRRPRPATTKLRSTRIRRSKWWALAIPSWVCVSVAYVWFVYDRCSCDTPPRPSDHARGDSNSEQLHLQSRVFSWHEEEGCRRLKFLLPSLSRHGSLCALRAVPPTSRRSVYDKRSVLSTSGIVQEFSHAGAAIPAISDIPLSKVCGCPCRFLRSPTGSSRTSRFLTQVCWELHGSLQAVGRRAGARESASTQVEKGEQEAGSRGARSSGGRRPREGGPSSSRSVSTTFRLGRGGRSMAATEEEGNGECGGTVDHRSGGPLTSSAATAAAATSGKWKGSSHHPQKKTAT